jgi:hypothetical protein
VISARTLADVSAHVPTASDLFPPSAAGILRWVGSTRAESARWLEPSPLQVRYPPMRERVEDGEVPGVVPGYVGARCESPG